MDAYGEEETHINGNMRVGLISELQVLAICAKDGVRMMVESNERGNERLSGVRCEREA